MPIGPRSGESALLTAAQALPFGVAITDSHGLITWTNAAYIQLSGCAPGQSAGEFPWEQLAQAAPSREPWTGEARTLKHTITTLRTPAGEVEGFWITVPATAAGPSLHHAEANLSALIESTHDLIWSVDLNFGLLTFNQTLQEDFGDNFGIRAAVGMRPQDLLPPERASLWPPLYNRALSSGPFRTEYPLVDGRILELSFNPILQMGTPTGISVFGKDITERKAAEKALREAKREYQDIFEGAIEGLYRTSMDGKALRANPAMAKMLGHDSPAEAVSAIADAGRQVWLDPDERSSFMKLLRDRGIVLGYECRFRRKDGTPIWVSLNSRIVRDGEGALCHEGFVEDITERKAAAAAMEPLRSVFENMGQGAAYCKLLFEGNEARDILYVAVNAAFEKLTGLTDVQGRKISEILPGIRQTNPELFETYARVVRTGRAETFEFFVAALDIWVLVSVYRSQPEHFLAVFENITERKLAAQRLERFEQIVNAAQSAANFGVWNWDAKTGKIECSNEAFRPYAMAPDTPDGGGLDTSFQGVHAEDRQRIRREFQQLLDSPDGRLNVEYRSADGLKWIAGSGRLYRDSEGRADHLVGISMDVTGQRATAAELAKTTQALAAAERYYRGIFNSVSDAVFVFKVWDDGLPSLILEVNDAACRYLGYTRDELLRMRVLDIAALDSPATASTITRRILDEGHLVWEGIHVAKDGRRIPVEMNTQVFDLDGSPTLIASVRDISERKNAEKQYRDIFDGALEGIYRTSLEGTNLAANPAFARMLGYDSADEVVATVTDSARQVWVNPNARAKFLRLLESKGSVRGYECQYKRKDGSVIWVSLNSRMVYGADGRALYTDGFIQDITESRQMRDAVRRSGERFAKAFRCSPAIMALTDLTDGRLIDVNTTFELLTGYGREEAVGRTAGELGLWIDQAEFEESAVQFRDTGGLRGFERRFRTKAGDIRTGLTSAERIELDGKECAISATIDITERKEAETRLKAQKERFQGIIEHSDAGYFRIGTDGCYEEVNPAWLRMHGFTGRDEAIGLHFSALQVLSRVGAAEEIVEALGRGESVKSSEFSRLRRDGSVGYHTFSANPVLDGDRVVGIEGFLVDISDRKKAEQEKQHVEQRYKSLFNSMHEGVGLHKVIYSNGIPVNYMLLDVNRRYEEIVGMTREQVGNKLATEVYGTNDAPYLKEYASVVETGSPLQFETYFPPMDRHFVISVAPMGEDGFATIFFDITEQKKAQQALQQANLAVVQAEAHHRLMFNSVSDAVFIRKFGRDGSPGQFCEVNDSACRHSGYSREELLCMEPSDIDAPEEHSNLPARARRLLADGHLMWEGTHVTKNGRRVPVEVNSRVVELDGAKTIISSVRDTSERKEAEEEYRNIFEGAPVGIIRTSSGGKILTANPALARMLGYESAEELVSTISDATHQLWLHADERARFIAIMEEDGSGREFECRLKRKDGTALWVSIEGRKVCGGDGRTLYYDGFVDDVTEHKRVQAEKAKLEEQLRQAQKLESVGRLAGGVAHDFNNLLTVINGYSNTVLKLLQDNDPLKPYVEEIGNAGERAAGLTRQLLTFSRKQVIEPKVMDLNDIIRESTPMLQRLIGEDIALTTDLEPFPGRVMADPDQIHQVIMNLAVNARDAMPDGGRLEIETRNVALDAENNVAAPAGRYVLVAVTDNGHGMDDATRERVFEPFFTTKETGKGTGLGLATVYGIIRQGGGWIDVSSRPGVGTSFKMYLPRVDARAQSAKRGPSAATEKGTGTILVVEDQQAVRKYTRSVLKRYGYDVIEACDGDEAITKAAQYDGEIRLLVTDVIMPGMNGKQLSERLRKVRPNLKVLFISGYTADIIAERGVLDRSVAFLHKPFGPEDLAAKVREVLAQTS